MNRHSLCFTAPYQITIKEEPLAPPAPDQLLVKTLVSAVSSGTELLIYRDQAPMGIPTDMTIPALAGELRYPLKYGYAAVGRVMATGSEVSPEWRGRLVFAFHPHESHFLALPSELIPLPSSLSPEEAALLPNMETAVNFLMDGRPAIGERVAVFGQGVVGLLTTALLSYIPSLSLVTLDVHPLRREKSLTLGAQTSLDPTEENVVSRLRELLGGDEENGGADLAYELSGNPAALDQAVAAMSYDGRIVVGSWYGRKRADLNLGDHFHRRRIQFISSQVSTIAPEWTGRWSKGRRLGVAWRLLEQLHPSHLITHRFPLAEAAQAYALLDRHPEQALQVVLTYADEQ